MNKLGNLIKGYREKKGFSQRQLAMYANVSNTEISKMESGERLKPNPNILKQIAPILGVEYEELMKAAGYLVEYDNVDEMIANEEQIPSNWYKFVKKADEEGFTPEDFLAYIETIKRYQRT